MSDITTKIIPVQHDYIASEEKVKAAVTYLSVKLPCCGHDSSLNALKYYLPCGFSRIEIGIENLEKTLDEEQLAEIGKILGTKVKVILARY